MECSRDSEVALVKSSVGFQESNQLQDVDDDDDDEDGDDDDDDQ